MNQAWLIFCMALAVAMFAGGWECRGWKDGIAAAHLAEAEQTNTINAQNAVIAKEKKSEQITTEVDTSYENALKTTELAYSFAGVPTGNSASHGMPAIPDAACRSYAAASKVFKLTAQQCDKEAAKLVALQQWVREQAQ